MSLQRKGASVPRSYSSHGFVVLLAVVGWLAALGIGTPAMAQQVAIGRDSIPSRFYFQGVNELYRGDYRDAGRVFQNEVRGSIKIGITQRWIDVISYHTMLGEVLYHQGQMALALEQYDLACAQFLRNPMWMLRVDFRPPRPDDNRLNQRPPPWGQSVRKFRLGKFQDSYLIRQGDIYSAERAIRGGGGVVQGPELWRVNVVETVRTTALAIRRRNELLGPLAEFDPISKQMLAVLSQGGAPPNHWANAWVELQLGLAYAGQGKVDLAMKRLQRAERVAGEFDHPLTCVALLEMGRLSLEAGKLDQAMQLFADASISAFYYDDLGTIDEAFRLSTICRLASNTESVNPGFDPAMVWARREGYDHIFSRLSLGLAEEALAVGNYQVARAALKTGASRLQDARQGLLGNQLQYLAARLEMIEGKESAQKALMKAVEQHIPMSVHNLQLLLANARFDGRQLQSRSALRVYEALLGDPQPADWVLRPLESLAVLKTPHYAAFDRWLAAVTFKDIPKTLEIADLAKRHRYLQSLSWGGRLAALRHLLEAPDAQMSPNALGQRNEILLRYPAYDKASKEGAQLLSEIKTDWKSSLEEREKKSLIRKWRQWDDNLSDRESLLRRIGAERFPVDIQFPAQVPIEDVQAQLKPGQALVVFHDTPEQLHGFLMTSRSAKRWDCGPSGRIAGPLKAFLRDLGNFDANHELSSEELTGDSWHKSGARLFDTLFEGSSIDPEAMTELLVVPDGLTWYVPWAALPIPTEDDSLQTLIKASKIRVAPLVGVAFNRREPLRRVLRTGIAGTAFLPGDTDQEHEEALAALGKAVENPFILPKQFPVPNPVVASVLEMLVVWDDIELEASDPYRWSPIPQGRSGKQTALEYWLDLPQSAPQRVLLPASHTVAERGGKVSKRRRNAPGIAGNELFLSSCGLLSTGVQTVLFSNWQVGGESTLELIREFVQELPYTSAADAWQRSVQLSHEFPIEPDLEPRVKAGKEDLELTAAHPIFWSGYVLVDVSIPPEDPSKEQEPEDPVAQLKD